MANEITPGTIDRCIQEIQARKLYGAATTQFFLDYFDLDSANELDARTLQQVNKRFAQYRLPTVDGSDVSIAEETTQNDLWTKKVGN